MHARAPVQAGPLFAHRRSRHPNHRLSSNGFGCGGARIEASLDDVEAASQPRYCDLNINFYEELMKLPKGEALIAMRFLLESK